MKSGSDSDRPAARSTADADAIPLLTERLYVATLPPVADISAVRDAVLDDLERSLPGQIESMIRREVSNAIDDAVFRVVAETQDALARALGQVVERAVRDELTRLRNEDG